MDVTISQLVFAFILDHHIIDDDYFSSIIGGVNLSYTPSYVIHQPCNIISIINMPYVYYNVSIWFHITFAILNGECVNSPEIHAKIISGIVNLFYGNIHLLETFFPSYSYVSVPLDQHSLEIYSLFFSVSKSFQGPKPLLIFSFVTMALSIFRLPVIKQLKHCKTITYCTQNNYTNENTHKTPRFHSSVLFDSIRSPAIHVSQLYQLFFFYYGYSYVCLLFNDWSKGTATTISSSSLWLSKVVRRYG